MAYREVREEWAVLFVPTEGGGELMEGDTHTSMADAIHWATILACTKLLRVARVRVTIEEIEATGQLAKPEPSTFVGCIDCGAPYSELGLDLVLPDQQWNKICPEGGILCANCICKRAARFGGTVLLSWIDQIDWSIEGPMEPKPIAQPEKPTAEAVLAEIEKALDAMWYDHVGAVAAMRGIIDRYRKGQA